MVMDRRRQKRNDQTLCLLDSLVEMTRHRARASFGAGLIKALEGLLPAKKVRLHGIRRNHEPVAPEHPAGMCVCDPLSHADTPANRPAWNRAVIECLEKRAPVALETPADRPGVQTLFPVIDHAGKPVGILTVNGGEIDARSLRLIEGVLRLYLNYSSLLEDSQRDRLTGLLNRDTFIGNVNEIIAEQRKRKNVESFPHPSRRKPPKGEHTFWMGVVDIDHFKRVNDTYGHLYGDEVLILLARIMKSCFRQEDVLFCYGGEEFVVLTKVPWRDDASASFERFRKTVEAYEFPQVGRVTVSIGYALITGKDFPLTVFDRADKALYYAKTHGRNCIFSYECLVREGKLAGDEAEKEMKGTVELFRDDLRPHPPDAGRL